MSSIRWYSELSYATNSSVQRLLSALSCFVRLTQGFIKCRVGTHDAGGLWMWALVCVCVCVWAAGLPPCVCSRLCIVFFFCKMCPSHCACLCLHMITCVHLLRCACMHVFSFPLSRWGTLSSASQSAERNHDLKQASVLGLGQRPKRKQGRVRDGGVGCRKIAAESVALSLVPDVCALQTS